MGEVQIHWEAARSALITEPGAAGISGMPDEGWRLASVPGTVAGLLRDFGEWADGTDLDSQEWWYRAAFSVEPAEYCLNLDGLATVSDVWLDGVHVLHSENMFRSHELDTGFLDGHHTLVIRFASLSPLLKPRKPRPRWRTYLVEKQSLRWVRTTLLGRMPEWTVKATPVGPYRPIRLAPRADIKVSRTFLATGCPTETLGDIDLRFLVEGQFDLQAPVEVRVVKTADSGASGPVAEAFAEPIAVDGSPARPERREYACRLRIHDVERWWPHTHGPQPLYAVEAVVGSQSYELGRVGFRTVAADRSDGGFQLHVNGVPVFCRGAGWMPIDPVSLTASRAETEATVDLMVRANLNMVRFVGTTVYPDQHLLDLCDERGLLVWQDCMFAHMDPPEDAEFEREVIAELAQQFRRLQGRPSLAVVCGSAEMEEQAAMLGLTRADWRFPLFDSSVPELVYELLPSVPYVRSTPTGGCSPLSMNEGLSHYFGVGGFLQPLDDARKAQVRFATECLMFATPPEPSSVEEGFGAAFKAGHDPTWKATIHRDTGRSSDTEDVVDFYKKQLFGVEPTLIRHATAERSLDLARATVVECMSTVMTEFRRNGSRCDGAMLMAFRDLRIGAGFGLVDAYGRPKAPWYALRRLFEPVALLVTNEGLNGLTVHVVNDTERALSALVRIQLYADGVIEVDRAEANIEVAPRGKTSLSSDCFFDSFRDITYSYRFAAPAHDVVLVSMTALPDGEGPAIERQEIFLPLGPRRDREHDVGLTATASPTPVGSWEVKVSTDRFAQYVALDVPGFVPADSWFHLGPGQSRTLGLTPIAETRSPTGEVRALNARVAPRIDRLE